MNLNEEADRATELLKGRIVDFVKRHREGEVMIQFTDGTRLFVDKTETGIELSIT